MNTERHKGVWHWVSLGVGVSKSGDREGREY